MKQGQKQTPPEEAIQTAVNRAYTTKTATSDILDDLYMVTHDPDDKAPVTEVRKVLQADGYRGGSSQAKREIDRWMTLNNIKRIKRYRFFKSRNTCFVGIKYKGERCEECGKPEILGELARCHGGGVICFKCQ